MNKVLVCLASLMMLAHGHNTSAREQKEFDSDVNYNEAKIPHYDLPSLLVTAEGEEISTPEEWMTIRRPQILALFSNLVYGCVPTPQSPIETEYEVLKTDPDFMDGKATRQDVQIRFSNDQGKAEMVIVLYVPNDAARPRAGFHETQLQ